MFDWLKVKRLYDKCFNYDCSYLSDAEDCAKNMLKEGRSHIDIVMFILLYNHFLTLSEKNGEEPSHFFGYEESGLTNFGVETLLRVKENPSVFIDVHKCRERYKLKMWALNALLDSPKEEKSEWEKNKKIVLKNLDKLQEIYEKRIFP